MQNELPSQRRAFWPCEIKRPPDLPDGQADLLLNFGADLVDRGHQELPKQKAWSPYDLPILLRLGAEEKFKNHLQDKRRNARWEGEIYA